MLNRRHHLLLYRSIVVGVLSLMRSAPRLLIVAIGSCAYAGLAVLGWGGFRSFVSHSAFVALVVVLLALSVVASFAGGNLSAGVREARGNRWVIPVFVIIGFLNAYLPAYTDRRELWTIDGDTIRWVGVALFAAGGALRTWPVFVLGPRFSGLVAIQPGHTLVTSGVYRVIRHPSYLGLLMNHWDGAWLFVRESVRFSQCCLFRRC
jgi:protein-S-isoprenylcysteine O-methyltransferase Ste14